MPNITEILNDEYITNIQDDIKNIVSRERQIRKELDKLIIEDNKSKDID